jgi:hypothetical protein
MAQVPHCMRQMANLVPAFHKTPGTTGISMQEVQAELLPLLEGFVSSKVTICVHTCPAVYLHGSSA